jgi:hypothetical protein
MTMDANLWSLLLARRFKMKYIREIIAILIIIIGATALLQNCKKNHKHKPESVVIQHAAGPSQGPGPFG